MGRPLLSGKPQGAMEGNHPGLMEDTSWVSVGMERGSSRHPQAPTDTAQPPEPSRGTKRRKQLSAEPALSSSAIPSSDVGRFLLSSSYWIGRKQLRTHLIFNGSSCFQDAEEQSKRTESTRKWKCPFSLAAFFFFLLQKCNACMRALRTWTPHLQIFSPAPWAVTSGLGTAVARRRSRCSPVAPRDHSEPQRLLSAHL